jgi:methionyl-tRNA formyltransferase
MTPDTSQRRRAVVFAYHNVGVRCLKALLAHDVDVALVVSHTDNPDEAIWFESVQQTARTYNLPCITPASANDKGLMQHIHSLAPDVIFSFYYRLMIPKEILTLARIGAFNMHGSLLPKYRGRVPINWAIAHGETETGATLHEMVAQPDAGAIIQQLAVPILPDDTAIQVFQKVVVAAELVLCQALPNILANQIQRLPNQLDQGSYFGGRKPEDGRIDWSQSAQAIYNLYRAVAPPYPGAFTEIGQHKLVITQAHLDKNAPKLKTFSPGLHVVDNSIVGVGGDGKAIQIKQLTDQGQILSAMQLQAILGA